MAGWDEDEGDQDDGSTPLWAARRSGPPPPVVTPEPARLLRPLARAEDLLSRLDARAGACLLYTSPSPRDRQKSRMPSSA